MVGCEAVGCSNRTEKGFKLYAFPVDPERKRKWMIKARRMDLKNVTKSRKLCEAHFEDDQFSTTKKGKRRLRKDAVPTLFTHRVKKKKRKPPADRTTGPPVDGEHNYTAEIKSERKDGEEKTPTKTKKRPSIQLSPPVRCKQGAKKKAVSKDGAVKKVASKASPVKKVTTKDAAATVIPAKDGAETEISTKDGTETEVPTKDVAAVEGVTILVEGVAETEISAVVVSETGILPIDGTETEIPPNDGTETAISTKDGEETGISTTDAAETEIPSEDMETAESEEPLIEEPKEKKVIKRAKPTKIKMGTMKNLRKMESMLEEQQLAIETAQREALKQQKAILKAQREAKKARATLKRVRKEKAAMLRRNELMGRKLAEVFTEDQIKALGRGNTQGMLWSNTTIERALQILFAAGPTGYKALQDLHIPLPAVRTLQRRMQGVKFEPGILEEVFAILKIKAAGMSELERECVLTFDEMAITQSVEVHKATGRQYGEITLPGHTGPATRTCVFMLAGTTTTQWQQIVAYHYSGNSTQGEVYKPIILEIIQRASVIGLHVIDVTTDMASPNQAMWRSFGVDHNNICIPHPVTPERQLYFMPDVPHLVKNMRNALVNGHVIALPDEIVERENLTSNLVSLEPIRDLINVQEGSAQKIAPKLSRKSIEPTHLEKKKIGPAKDVFSIATSAGLKHMVEKEGRSPDHLATAWFLEQVSKWVDLMSFRHPVTALSSLKTPEYENAKVFLSGVIDLFCNISIGATGEWTPIQTGVVMATRSMLAIQEEMLAKGHTFVLTAKFTLECLEGVFSCVRYRNPAPTPVALQKALRVISVGQFDSSDSKKWELPGRPRVPSRSAAKAAKRKSRSPSEGGEGKRVKRERKKQKIGKSERSKSPKKQNQAKKAKKAVVSKRPRATKVSNPLLVSMNTVGIPVVQLNTTTPVSYISAPCIMSPSYTYTSL